MLIQRQFHRPSAIELRFEEVVGLQYFGQADIIHDHIINCAAFFIRDGIFYWADYGDWTPDWTGENTWVAARKVSWRDVSEWMGASLRYRDSDKIGP